MHITHIYFTDTYKCFHCFLGLFLLEDVQYSSLPTLSKDVLPCACNAARCQSASERDIFAWRWQMYMWIGWSEPETYHDVLQKWTVINDSCCTRLVPLEQLTVLLQNLNWLKVYLPVAQRIWHERQESEQRLAKRAFGRANSALVFQEALLINMHRVPFTYLFYGDKSVSRLHCVNIQSTVPIEDNM